MDIPICDPFRIRMSSSVNGVRTGTFNFGQGLMFEAYVQFKEYIGFAKCMHALQGKKLVRVEEDGTAWSANIKVRCWCSSLLFYFLLQFYLYKYYIVISACFCSVLYSIVSCFSASQVDFDRTKHLSEYSIKKRNAEREKLEAADREKEEKLRRKREMEEMKLEAER